ncbi:MAG: hypothetical protein ABII01_01880 [Candidatus Woesearchaeota archaeon]
MELIILIIVALLSFFIIAKSAGYMLLAITNYAKKTGMSHFLIGFLVIAIGTSLPELSTGIMSAIVGKNVLSLGNVIGANILDVTLILGINLIVMKKIKNIGFVINRSFYLLYIIILLLLILGIDGVISRIDGLILLIIFSMYIISLIRKEHELGKIKKSIKFKHVIVDMLTFLFALTALLLATRWLVFASIEMSGILDIPIFLIGLIFVSITTTMPEFMVSIKSALKKQNNISFGNLIGAVSINSSLVIGVSALINPIVFEFSQFFRPLLFMITSVFITSMIFRKKIITSEHGFILVIIYVLFIFTEIVF